MTGVVTDTTGAVIPGTLVSLSNASTGVKFTQNTDNLGSYRFLNVPPSPGYKAVFTRAGFTTAEFTDITLIVGVTRTQNARLVVGAASQTVQVSASDAIVTLDTTDAAIGNNIDVEDLEELPVYDRSLESRLCLCSNRVSIPSRELSPALALTSHRSPSTDWT